MVITLHTDDGTLPPGGSVHDRAAGPLRHWGAFARLRGAAAGRHLLGVRLQPLRGGPLRHAGQEAVEVVAAHVAGRHASAHPGENGARRRDRRANFCRTANFVSEWRSIRIDVSSSRDPAVGSVGKRVSSRIEVGLAFDKTTKSAKRKERNFHHRNHNS